jgi:hypothetical protein
MSLSVNNPTDVINKSMKVNVKYKVTQHLDSIHSEQDEIIHAN